MEQELEIICRDTSDAPIQNNHKTIEAFVNKIKELIKTYKHNTDTWEIPKERISIKDPQGFGSQGDVFYGLFNSKAVAIKKVRDQSLTKRSYLGDLDHKNLIKFKGVNSECNYIIMEWCPYGNLENLIHSGRRIPSNILADFGLQIANGMNYLHSKKIIHCDLKPSNILLTHNNVLKISDFESHQLYSRPCRTDIIGTAPYMAPEMIRGEDYSFPVDVWSYGVVLWEILTGHKPYENSHSPALFWAVGNETHNSRLHIPSNFPSGYRYILEGCWQSQPKSRLTFAQICLKSQSAMNEIFKISKDPSIPLQTQWNKSSTEDGKCNKNNPDEEDLIAQMQRLARDEKQMSKVIKKYQNIYLGLQETSMLLERGKKDVARREAELTKREQEFTTREQASLHELAKQKQKLEKAREEFEKFKQETMLELDRRDRELSSKERGQEANEKEVQLEKASENGTNDSTD